MEENKNSTKSHMEKKLPSSFNFWHTGTETGNTILKQQVLQQTMEKNQQKRLFY